MESSSPGNICINFREHVLFNCEPRCNSLKIDQLQCRLAMSTAELAKGDLKATYSATDNTIDVKQKSNKFNMFVPILGEEPYKIIYYEPVYATVHKKKEKETIVLMMMFGCWLMF